MVQLPSYRLRVTASPESRELRPYVTYIVRNKSGAVYYMNASESPLALSNLVFDDAAAMRFVLEDAPNGEEAASALQAILDGQWAGNKPRTPKVEVLS